MPAGVLRRRRPRLQGVVHARLDAHADDRDRHDDVPATGRRGAHRPRLPGGRRRPQRRPAVRQRHTCKCPLAVGWWAIGHMADSRAAPPMPAATCCALRSTRPGSLMPSSSRSGGRVPTATPRSFPSGHASATFATATVLQRHYGWKLGLPFYLLGVYTAASRDRGQEALADRHRDGRNVWRHGGPGRDVSPEAAARTGDAWPCVPGGAQLQFVVEP